MDQTISAPRKVMLAIQLLWISLAFALIHMVLTLPWDENNSFISFFSILVTLAILAALFWFLSKRQGWIRWVLLVLWIISLPALFDNQLLQAKAVLAVQTAIEAVALFLLFTSESTTWFKLS